MANQEAQSLRDVRKITRTDLRDLTTAVRALDRIADRHGESSDGDWHDYDFDALSSARSVIAQWKSEHEA